MPKKLRNGVGAAATILKKFPHLKEFKGDMYANIGPHERINDLVMVIKVTKTIKWKPKTVIFFRHNDIPNDSIYISEKYCKVLK